jgi:hypothetical protein
MLSGRGPRAEARSTLAAAPTAPAAKPIAPAKPAARGAPLTSDRVQLVGNGGRALQIGVRTEVGKHLARQFGSDADFWDVRQLVLERRPDKRWQVTPVPGTANETLLNSEILTAPQPLHEGDVIAVGRKASGIIKLPLTVSAL